MKVLLVAGLEYREHALNKEKKELEKTFNSNDIDTPEDFNIISEKILSLLENWGSLPYETISVHLGYPPWMIWTVLKKLKAKKKVNVENGEWFLYE